MNSVSSVTKMSMIKTPKQTRNLSKVPSVPSVYKKDLYFKNWAPEVINGRSAMLGIVSGGGYELLTGQSVLDQPYNFEAFVLSTGLITMISLMNGEPRQKSSKPFTPTVEMLNGRIAMLGVASYLINNLMI